MARKHKANFMRDVRFYLRNRHRFTFTGSEPVRFDYDRNGVDGLTAYKRLDSDGIMVATRHPLLASTLARVKASVNFQVKEWKAGYSDMAITVPEMKDYLEEIGAPAWLYKAIDGGGSHTYVIFPEAA